MKSLTKIAVPRQRLADLVYQQILQALHNGEIATSDALHQARLAELLSVSRTPVREALLRLEQEGILDSGYNGGFKLRTITAKSVRDIYQTRLAIEGYAAKHLAENKSPQAIEQLSKLVCDLENKVPTSSQEFYETNRLIHRSFIEATKNKYLLEMFDSLWNRSLAAYIYQTMDTPFLAETLTGHKALCDALVGGNGIEAERVMQEHIWEGCALQISALEALQAQA